MPWLFTPWKDVEFLKNMFTAKIWKNYREEKSEELGQSDQLADYERLGWVWVILSCMLIFEGNVFFVFTITKQWILN